MKDVERKRKWGAVPRPLRFTGHCCQQHRWCGNADPPTTRIHFIVYNQFFSHIWTWPKWEPSIGQKCYIKSCNILVASSSSSWQRNHPTPPYLGLEPMNRRITQVKKKPRWLFMYTEKREEEEDDDDVLENGGNGFFLLKRCKSRRVQ